MYYFLDNQGKDYEFGNADQSVFIMNSAKESGLNSLYKLFSDGWSDSKEEIVSELKSTDWTDKRGYDEVIDNLLKSIESASFPIIIPQT